MKKYNVIIISVAMCMFVLAGCKKETAKETTLPEPAPEAPVEEEEFVEYEEIEEIPEDEIPEEEEKPADNSMAVGVWYTEGFDEENNWAGSYKIDLSADGKATCEGWRNKDSGTYEVTGDNRILITFDKCETDSPGEGFVPVEGFKYTIEMTITGDDAQIKIDAPDVISNLEDGEVHRRSDNSKAEESDKKDAVSIADGEYVTDEKYKGDISADGSTITIETALSHYDKDWNTILDYKKDTYVLTTSKNCKCVIYQEDVEEYPVAEQIGFINEFLHGNSGLPITFKIVNNEVTEIGFSS